MQRLLREILRLAMLLHAYKILNQWLLITLVAVFTLYSGGSANFTVLAQGNVLDSNRAQFTSLVARRYTSAFQVVSDQTAPIPITFVGGYPTTTEARALAVSGNLALVTDSTDKLRIIDIRNPAQPLLLSRFTTPEVPSQIKIEGTLAAVAVQGTGVYLLDLSTPATPRQVGFYPLNQDDYLIEAIELSQKVTL